MVTIRTLAPPLGRWFALASLLLLASPAPAKVVFFIQRQGSTDDGVARFLALAPAVQTQDFEAPELGANGSPLPMCLLDKAEVSLEGEDGGPYTPTLWKSPEFNEPNRIYQQALYVGASLLIEVDRRDRLAAVGFWVFDDRRAYDAAYLVTVTEVNGHVSTARLENDIPLNSKGHEVEGFVGAVSKVGIVSLQLTAIDPATGAPIPDQIEIDTLMVARHRPHNPDAFRDACASDHHWNGNDNDDDDADADADDFDDGADSDGHHGNGACVKGHGSRATKHEQRACERTERRAAVAAERDERKECARERAADKAKRRG